MPPGPKNKLNLLWHSALGIVLGVGGGWLVLSLLLYGKTPSQKTTPNSSTKQRSTKTSVQNARQTKHRASLPPNGLSLSRMSVAQLYQKCKKEAALGSFGKTFGWLHKNQRSFPLWPHLYWLLAEGALRIGQSKNAIISYKNLSYQNNYLWSKRVLFYRSALASYKNLQKKQALKYLQIASRYRSPRKKKRGWVWWQQERRSIGEELWLHSQLVGFKKRARLYQELWTQYPDSSRALAAERGWWALWLRRYTTPGSKQFLKMAELYLTTYGDVNKARKMLHQVKRRSLSRSKKRTFQALWVRYYMHKGQLKKAFQHLNKQRKLRKKRKQAPLYYQMAILALRMSSRRKWGRVTRKLKRRSRYWYAQAMLQKGLHEAAKGRTRQAKKSWKKAWKASRSHSLRKDIYLYRALLLLKKRRKARKAKKEFSYAVKQVRRLSRYQKKRIPPYLFAYWYARSDERRGRKKRAVRQYKKIFTRVPFSFYGLLAAKRLQAMRKLPPLPFVKPDHPKLKWKIPQGAAAQPIQVLSTEGPASLYLMELESWAMKSKRPPIGLLSQMAQLGNKKVTQSHAMLWLHQYRRFFLRGRHPVSRSLLMAAYPSPDLHWPKWIARARSHKLDTRLVAALLMHYRGFHPKTRRSRHIGPQSSPLWLKKPMIPPVSTFDESCRRLRKLLNRYKHIDLALEALLTQNQAYIKNLKRSFPQKIQDLRYPLLSKMTRRVLQTYWIYQLLYLP